MNMMNDKNIKKKLDSLYIVMPAYNEEEAIEQVVLSWYECLKGKAPESRLVVADSGSQDRTHEILVELQKSHPQLEILGDTLTTHGPKLIALYRYAQLKGADYIFQTDSDGQTEVSEFDAFWKKRRKYEALIGYRKKRGDGIVRKFVEKVVCFLLQIIFGVKVPDANAPYRLRPCGDGWPKGRATSSCMRLGDMERHLWLQSTVTDLERIIIFLILC